MTLNIVLRVALG